MSSLGGSRIGNTSAKCSEKPSEIKELDPSLINVIDNAALFRRLVGNGGFGLRPMLPWFKPPPPQKKRRRKQRDGKIRITEKRCLALISRIQALIFISLYCFLSFIIVVRTIQMILVWMLIGCHYK